MHLLGIGFGIASVTISFVNVLFCDCCAGLVVCGMVSGGPAAGGAGSGWPSFGKRGRGASRPIHLLRIVLDNSVFIISFVIVFSVFASFAWCLVTVVVGGPRGREKLLTRELLTRDFRSPETRG